MNRRHTIFSHTAHTGNEKIKGLIMSKMREKWKIYHFIFTGKNIFVYINPFCFLICFHLICCFNWLLIENGNKNKSNKNRSNGANENGCLRIFVHLYEKITEQREQFETSNYIISNNQAFIKILKNDAMPMKTRNCTIK